MWVTCVHEKLAWALGFPALGNRGGFDERGKYVLGVSREVWGRGMNGSRERERERKKKKERKKKNGAGYGYIEKKVIRFVK